MISRSCRLMLRKVPSNSLLRTLHTSNAKPNPSHLLSNSTAQYQAMTVGALKTELKSRGLRVAGRKAELVDRLSTFDARRNMSGTASAHAKGDTSNIDFFHIPKKEAGPKVAKTTIPAVPHISGSAKEIEVEVTEPVKRDAAATSGAVTSLGGRDVSSMNTDLGDAAQFEDYDESEKLPARDKTILAALLAGVATFWGADALWKRRSNA